ncbi:MAG: type IV pilin [Methanomicrobiales archaeon]|nr:type IV pilin [Methanomicrobiales archaeon]
MIAGQNRAESQTIAVILLISITVLLALLVLLMFRFPAMTWGGPPAIFVITDVYHTSDQFPYRMNYDSRVVLVHNGSIVAKNDDLRAYFYRDDMPIPAVITTMNGYRFIQTRHFGVQWIGGSGCAGDTWAPGEHLVIDFTDGTFRPGDVVRIDVVQKWSSVVISRHTHIA